MIQIQPVVPCFLKLLYHIIWHPTRSLSISLSPFCCGGYLGRTSTEQHVALGPVAKPETHFP